MNESRLEVGGLYVNGYGALVKIAKHDLDDRNFPFKDYEGYRYCKYGRCSNGIDNMDLVKRLDLVVGQSSEDPAAKDKPTKDKPLELRGPEAFAFLMDNKYARIRNTGTVLTLRLNSDGIVSCGQFDDAAHQRVIADTLFSKVVNCWIEEPEPKYDYTSSSALEYTITLNGKLQSPQRIAQLLNRFDPVDKG